MLAAQRTRGQRTRGQAPSGNRHVLVVAAVLALLLAVLALLTALGGTSQFGDARTGGIVDGPLFGDGQPPPPDRAQEEAEQRPEVRPPAWLPVLLVLVLAAVLALVARALMRSRAPAERAEAEPPAGDAEGDPAAIVVDELRATALAAAEQVRRDGSGAADAVVRCWEELERHGERLGTPRAAHETPTEYGSDLLRRHGADPAAVDELLRLFHRARFGHGELPEGAAARAAQALTRVADTLRGGNSAGDVRA